MSNDVTMTEADDHVATIEIHRGPDNYLDEQLVSAIADRLDQLETDLDCRAVVLVSEGKHFCAGAQLDPEGRDLPLGDTNPLYDEVVRLFQGSVPIVAAVQGAAIGAGVGLALAADFRVATPQTRFATTFAKLGFHQGFGLSTTLPTVVGASHALDMLYTAKRVGGEEALAIGLCDRLVELDGLRDAAHDLALQIAESAPLAVRAIRRTMRGHLYEAVRVETGVEHQAQKTLRQTADYREGVTATAERRPPVFTGQ